MMKEFGKLAGKYGVSLSNIDDETPPLQKRSGTRLLDPDIALSIELANTKEKGHPNVTYDQGLPSEKDRTATFDYTARGIAGDPGVYWQTYLADPLVKSTVDAGYEGLVSGVWDFEPHEDTPEAKEEKAREQAMFCKRSLLDNRSAWKDFLKGWTFGDRVYGFGLWEIVDHGEGDLRGGVKKLAYRRPGTVKEWLFDEGGRRWAGTTFEYSDNDDVTIPSEDLLLYSTGIGLDLEGTAALRPVVRWVEVKQLITRIEAAAAESHGVGYKTVVPLNDVSWDEEDIKEITSVIAGMAASDNPVFAYSDAQLEWISPGGKLPDFEAMRKYCDDQIALALQSTGSLIGLGSTGTYNLAEIKDQAENIRRIRYYGQAVCDLINEEIIPRIVDNVFGGPVEPGLYPQLTFAVGAETKDTARFDKIVAMVQAGVLNWTLEDESWLRVEMDLPIKLIDEKGEGEGGGESLGGSGESGEEEEGGDDDYEGEPALEASHHHDHDHDHEHPDIEFSHDEQCDVLLSSQPSINLSEPDPTAVGAWIAASNRAIGRSLRKVGEQMRDDWVDATEGVQSPHTLLGLQEQFRKEYRPLFAAAAARELLRLEIKGGASVLRELGIVEGDGLPVVPDDLDDAFRKFQMGELEPVLQRFTDLQSSRVGGHALNVTESYLTNQATKELEGGKRRKRPDIPSESAYTKHAKTYSSRSLQHGRQSVMTALLDEARKHGMDEPKVVAQYVSVQDRDTCEPCRLAHGTRCFVHSGTYDAISPPNLCLGGDRCYCLWFYMLPSEAGWEGVVEGLRGGFNASVEGDSSSALDFVLGFFRGEVAQ